VAINNTAGGYRRVTWVERLVEISREETAKRAKLFLPGEGQTLISENFFEQGMRTNKSRSADVPRRVRREQIAKSYRIHCHLGD